MQVILKNLLIAFVVAVAIVGCNLMTVKSDKEQLPMVKSLPPPQLPDWIESISPLGEATPQSQIRVSFKNPIIPLENLDSPRQLEILEKFEMLPPLPGKFIIYTPRLVAFQADKIIPKATIIQITLKKGLADLNNHSLQQDLAWTFETEKIKLTNLPNSDNQTQPIDIKPTLTFTSNVELDINSVQQNFSLVSQLKNQKTSSKIALKEKQDNAFIYTITPENTLEKATNYNLEFAPGVQPLNGNLASETKYSSQVTTYAPLAFENIQTYGQPDGGGAYGRFVKGAPQLKFNNGITAESAIANITLSPAPQQGVKVIQAYDGENLVTLNPWALEPATKYTITINTNLQDKFGQKLTKPVTINYDTGDLASDIWAASGLNIFPANSKLRLNVSTVNLPESRYLASYRVVKPTDLIYSESAYPSGNTYDLLNNNQWSSFTTGGKKNETYENIIPVPEKLGASTGMLAYGVKAKTNTYQENNKTIWREADFYGLVQLTNLGVFAQWFPQSGLVKVNHLDDGSPVKNAKVEIYQSKLYQPRQQTNQPCLVSKTDETGTLIIAGDSWQSCLKNQEAPELLVIAYENKDWAFARTDQYSGAYEYGITAGWDYGQKTSRGIIFSDRKLYQPGEKAWLTAVAYYLENGQLQQDKNTDYQITLTNPEGVKIDLGTKTTNEFATFSLELPLEKNLPLGYYSILAKSKNGLEIFGEIRLAEFKPPNFQVNLSLDKQFALIGEKITATTESKYLFGSPLQGGKAKYYVTREKTDFVPKGWEKFNFGRQWLWPEQAPEIPSDVLQSNLVLDNTGKISQIVPIAPDLPYPMNYRVESQVSDVSNLSVASTQTIVALPSDRLIGLQSDFIATAGKVFPVQVVVTNPQGEVITGEKIKIELQEIKYSSLTQIEEGSDTAKNQIEYKMITQQIITSGDKPQTINFTPSESGTYRLQANLINSKNDSTATDSQIWVTGDTAINWGDRYSNNRLEIQLDKSSYQVGDTATALIASPYPEGDLYFAVVRNNTIYSTSTKVKGSAPEIKFTITPEMLPNAAVEAVLVRTGQSLTETSPGSVDKLMRIGFTPFDLNLEDKYLQVQLIPGKEKQEPGQEQTIQLELKDKQGKPTEGQITLMVVNEALLQLTGYRLPDLVKTVYAQQDISTRFSDNRPNVVLKSLSSPLEKGWGYGGGLSDAAANTTVRKDFQALAYYNGSVITDKQGKASLTFKLPDDLTTWRVMAVATDGDLHFGSGETTFISTKPLISNPVLPQFARVGDRFDGGLSVTNTTGNTGNLTIKGSATGNLKFEKTPDLKTSVATQTSAYRFPIEAKGKGESKIKFVTQLNNQESDAFEVPLEIKSTEITEQVVETGVTNNQVKIPLNVDSKRDSTAGGLEISLASTLIPEIMAPAKQVFTEDELPFLETNASQLAIAANLQLLGKKYPTIVKNYNLTQQANLAIANLEKLQQVDGGFANIPGNKDSNIFLTPYAAESIAIAKTAGFTINPQLVSKLKIYLNNLLANPNQYKTCTNILCQTQVRLESMIALAALGENRSDFISSVYEQWQKLEPVNQIKLARYLSQFPQWQNEASKITQQIKQNISQTARNATINLPPQWSWFNSNTTEQAQSLRLFISQKASPEIIDKLLQGLLAMRRQGTWQNSYDNAQALSALVEYSNLQSKPPQFTTTVELAKKQLGKFDFVGYQSNSAEIKVPMSQLPTGKNDVIINKTGEGQLHYLTAYNYKLEGNKPGRVQGLRVIRYIRPVNEENILRTINLYALDEPLRLPVGEVFDIELEIITDHPVNNLIIKDYLPAGLEAIDSSLKTSGLYLEEQESSWAINYYQLYKDRVLGYSDRLDTGVYKLHYLVRSVTPGTFSWPGAEIKLQYNPEEFGRCAFSWLEIKQ